MPKGRPVRSFANEDDAIIAYELGARGLETGVLGGHLHRLRADLVARHQGLGHDQLVFAVGVTAVADQAGQTHTTRVGILHNALGDVVGSVHGHHFARADDVDFLRLVFADRHGEAAAHHVAENVKNHNISIF